MARIIEPPEESEYGYVVARVIRRVGDSGSDPDDYPDAVAVKGSVRFSPLVKMVRTQNYSAFELRESITQPFNDDGELSQQNETGSIGCWLLVGDYIVTSSIRGGSLPKLTITVTTSHTLENPLNLVDLF